MSEDKRKRDGLGRIMPKYRHQVYPEEQDDVVETKISRHKLGCTLPTSDIPIYEVRTYNLKDVQDEKVPR